ncbi:hypothetical protein Tco_0808412 [Tanacetum coccineum]
MHILKDPSFFLTNRTGAPQGEQLGLINHLSASSCSLLDSSCIFDGASIYGAHATGAALGTKSIWNLTCLAGESPGKSSGKTSGKFQSIDTSLSRFSSDFSPDFFSLMCAKNTWQPFCRSGSPTVSSHMASLLAVVSLYSAWTIMVKLALVAMSKPSSISILVV